MTPDFRNRKFRVCIDSYDNTNCHNDQAETKYRVNLTDDLINGQEGGDEIVHQNQHQPEQLVGEDTGAAAVGEQELDQTSRTHGEHGTDHDQQHNAEYTHDILHGAAQVDAGDLGDRGALVTLAEHTGEVNERIIDYYKQRAKGGTGLITIEAASVYSPQGASGAYQLRIDHDNYIPGLYR